MSKRKKHIKNSGMERGSKEVLKMKESIEEAKDLQEVLNSCVSRCSDIFPLLIYISAKQEYKKVVNNVILADILRDMWMLVIQFSTSKQWYIY